MTQIITFDKLPRVKDALYVLDIDNTVLYYVNNCDDNHIKDIREFEKTMNKTDAFDKANAIWEANLYTEEAFPIDKKSINNLKTFCDCNNSKLIFLTARFESVRDITEVQMKKLFSWVSPDSIYMCSGVEKGVMLKALIAKDYTGVIFVDDKQYNIDSVSAYLPYSSCFLFKK